MTYRPILSGVLYGIAVYIVMYWMVMPTLACSAAVFLAFRRGTRNPHSFCLRWFTYLADRALLFTAGFASRQN